MSTSTSPIGSGFDLGNTLYKAFNQPAPDPNSGNLWQNAKSNISQGLNAAADVGGWIKSLGSSSVPSYEQSDNGMTDQQRADAIAMGPGASSPASNPISNPPVSPQQTQNLKSNSFSQAFNALTPQQQQTFTQANPNIDTTTGQTKPNPVAQNMSLGVQNLNSGLYNGTGSSTGAASTGYGVSVPSTVPSNVVGAGNGYSDVLNYRNQMMDTMSNYLNTQLQSQQAINQAQLSGDTTDYGTGAANLAKMYAAYKNMQASIPAQVAAAGLSNATQMALGQNQQVAPGSTLVNQFTGQPVYQGMGALPQTVLSQAQNIFAQDQATGNVQYNPDGSVNQQYYQQKAQQQIQSLYGGGQNMNGGQNMGTGQSMSMQPGMNTPTVGTPMNQGGTGGYQAPQPGTPQFTQSLPATVAPAYRQTSTGQSYFDMSNLDTTGLGTARQISKAASAMGYSIPILSAEDSKAVQTVDQANKNLITLKSNFDSLATNSSIAALASNLSDPVSQLFQTNYGSALDTYNSNRDALLQQIRALAGMSPRLTNVELNLSQGALPTLTELGKDTLQTGDMKIQTVQGYLNNALSTLIPGAGGVSGQSVGQTINPTGGGSGGTQSQSSGSNPFSDASFYGQ